MKGFRITPRTWTPDEYIDRYSFTVKYKWVSNVCVWLLLRGGYACVHVQDLRFLSDDTGIVGKGGKMWG